MDHVESALRMDFLSVEKRIYLGSGVAVSVALSVAFLDSMLINKKEVVNVFNL